MSLREREMYMKNEEPLYRTVRPTNGVQRERRDEGGLSATGRKSGNTWILHGNVSRTKVPTSQILLLHAENLARMNRRRGATNETHDKAQMLHTA